MAVVYFTNNASTGAGSLVAAIANAQPGDTIRPDESVFERGATIEIVLASQLIIGKNLTLDASPFRVRLNGGGSVRCANVLNGAEATFTAFDFVNGYNTGRSGGCECGGKTTVTFNRCLFAGCRANVGAAIVAEQATVRLVDSLVTGCYSDSYAAIYQNSITPQKLDIIGSTIIGNYTGGSWGFKNLRTSYVERFQNNIVGPSIVNNEVVGVEPSVVGFVASPPNDLTLETWSTELWKSWDLRLLDDASDRPSPYRDSGDVDSMSRYDIDGNFRGRETNGVATCSPGAYETIQADLFWVGVDATGAEVVSPSFLTSDGWAPSRFATVSGAVGPTTGAALFVGETVSFNDAPPFAAALVVGADNVVIPSVTSVFLTIGAMRSAAVGGSLVALRLGDYSELTPSTSLDIPAVEFGGANIVIDNVSVEINDGVIFAAEPRPAAVTTTGSGGWADTTVGVSSLDVDATDVQTIAVSIVKNDANKAAFAQYSTDDGATWQTVATTADVDEYSLTVPQGADATVRVATATGWLSETVSTAPFLPVWTIASSSESVVGIANVFEIAPGGSNTGNNSYKFSRWGNL